MAQQLHPLELENNTKCCHGFVLISSSTPKRDLGQASGGDLKMLGFFVWLVFYC